MSLMVMASLCVPFGACVDASEASGETDAAPGSDASTAAHDDGTSSGGGDGEGGADGKGAGTCEDPTPFDLVATMAGPGMWTVSGTTLERDSALDGSCSENSAPEHVLAWTAPSTTTVLVEVDGSDPLVYVRSSCSEPDAELACNDDFQETESRLSFAAEAGETYFIVVDNYDAEEAGPYELRLSLDYVSPLQIPAGHWRSRGYGWGLSVTDTEATIYQVTEISCFVEQDGALGDLEGEFASAQVEGATGDVLRVVEWGSLSDRVFDRVDGFPGCEGGPTLEEGDDGYVNDPLFTWDVLDANFRDHYAFFEERMVDWPAVSEAQRAGLSADSTAAELGDAAAEALLLLNDPHTSLDAGPHSASSAEWTIIARFLAEHEAFGGDTSLGDYIDAGFEMLNTNVDGYLLEPAQVGDTLRWGRLSDDIGYVSVSELSVDDEDAFLETFDGALAELATTTTVVIDLRVNGGGSDLLALALAGRFTDVPVLAFDKRARHDGGFTEPFEAWIEPAADRWDGGVVVLTSEATLSAGENLVLMFRAIEGVEVVGQTTAGAFSDVFFRTLPNGWEVALSNEVFTAADGLVYEAVGIPPHVEVPGDLFDRDDRLAGTDRGLDFVLAHLEG